MDRPTPDDAGAPAPVADGAEHAPVTPAPPRRDAALRWFGFVSAVVLNLVVLYLPNPGQAPAMPGLDKVVHSGVFAVLAFTGLRVGLRPLWFLPLVLAHAVSSELVQDGLLPGRQGDVADAVADVGGTGIGWLLHRGVDLVPQPRR